MLRPFDFIAPTIPPISASDSATSVEVVVSAMDHAALRQHLLQNHLEQHAFLLAGVCRSARGVRLLVRDMIFAKPSDFIRQTQHYIELQPSYYLPVLNRCRAEGLCLIEAHSHPFCSTGVTFSDIDVANEHEKFAWYAEKLPHAIAATLVFAHDSVDGHWFDAGAIRPLHRLRVVGNGLNLQTMTSSRASGEVAPLDHAPFHRQELAFGDEGQQRIGAVRIGLVGCGGLGSVAAEQLAHLGVRDWVLVDPDIVETTNLNRVAFARAADAENARPKVEVIARGIRDIRRDAQVATVQNSVDSAAARAALCDVDLLIAGPDSDGARLVANELSVAYLIPLFDLGTGINVRDGKVSEAGGQMLMVQPGEGCLHCAGAIDPERARLDLMNDQERARHIARGYGTTSPQPSVMFLNAALASLAVGEIVKWLTGLQPPQAMLLYDALKPSVTAIAPPARDPKCPVCHRAALYGRGDESSATRFQRAVPVALLPVAPASVVEMAKESK